MGLALLGAALTWSEKHRYSDFRRYTGSAVCLRGDIAQLGERGVRIAEVGGSSPPISTSVRTPCIIPR